MVLAVLSMLFAIGVPAQTPAPKPAEEKAKKDAEKKAAPKKAAKAPVDLNTATEAQLLTLKGVNKATAQKILAARPFKTTDELVSKKLLSEPAYKQIEKQVVAK
jgi:competence protein ComEA